MAVTSASQNSDTAGKNIFVTIAPRRIKEPIISAGNDRKLIVNTLLQRAVGIIVVCSLISDGLIVLNTGLLDFLRLRFEYSTHMNQVMNREAALFAPRFCIRRLGRLRSWQEQLVGWQAVTNGAVTGS